MYLSYIYYLIYRLSISLNLLRKEWSNMATQIMATPILKGDEARKVLKESKRVASDKSKNGAKKLAEKFEKMVR